MDVVRDGRVLPRAVSQPPPLVADQRHVNLVIGGYGIIGFEDAVAADG